MIINIGAICSLIYVTETNNGALKLKYQDFLLLSLLNRFFHSCSVTLYMR